MTITASKEGLVPSVVPADNVPGKPQGQWTYEDYFNLPDDGNRYEIIDGVLYIMPSPNRYHQTALNFFVHYFLTHIQFKGRGWVFAAPFDVRLPTRANPVQPDVIVVLKANEAIIKDNFIEGVPDLVVEISSPGTVGYDRDLKKQAYAANGVKEYWLADPANKTIEVLILEEGNYRSAGVFTGIGKLPSKVIPKLPVKVEQFFQ